MIRRCLSWAEPYHAPLIFGEIEPRQDARYSDGVCPDCEAAILTKLRQEERVRLTVTLCDPARTVSGIYDRMGAALRLKWVRREMRDAMTGYSVEAVI